MMKNFIISIKNLFKDFFILWNYSSCYDHMESTKQAAFECCGGVAGGTRSTAYLSEMCIDCLSNILKRGTKINR
mgnify:CR=1 FL=1